MTLISALSGRARVLKTGRARRTLVLLLVLPFGLITLNRLVLDSAEAFLTYKAASSDWGSIVPTSRLMYCIGPLIGGVLVDRFGTKATIGLAAVGWCAVTSLGASLLDPMTFAVLAPPLLLTLPGLLHAGALAAIRRAFAPGRRATAFVVVTLVYAAAAANPFALYDDLVRPLLDQEDLASWQMPALALATCGAVLTGLWLIAFRDTDPEAAVDLAGAPGPIGPIVSDMRRIAIRPIVWGVLLLETMHGLVARQTAGLYAWTWQMMREGAVSAVTLVPVVGAAAAALIAAAWSDWILRKTRSLVRARLPFIVLGFAAIAVLPYAMSVADVGVRRQTFGPALLAGTALGALRMLDLLTIDLAPREMSGRFVGVVLAGETFALLYIAPTIEFWVRDASAVCVGAGIAGAILGALLLRRIKQSVDDNRSLFVRCFT